MAGGKGGAEARRAASCSSKLACTQGPCRLGPTGCAAAEAFGDVEDVAAVVDAGSAWLPCASDLWGRRAEKPGARPERWLDTWINLCIVVRMCCPTSAESDVSRVRTAESERKASALLLVAHPESALAYTIAY